MEKKDLDWANLSFEYQPTDYSYVSNYRDGAWDDGALTADHSIRLSECAGILHYCQEVFEGLKAYTTESGDVVCFRPDQNAHRMADSARRIVMPPFPEDRFVDAVEKVVRANAAWVPPVGSGATLCIRPLRVARGDVSGGKPADEYQFRILVTPVGAYYKGGVKPVKVQVSQYDRAAPHGTGNIKAGLNYAMSLYPSVEAHAAGYADNMFLDPETRTSLVDVAESYLGMKVIQRQVRFDEIDQFVECGMCGTAAVISPVGEVDAADKQVVYGMDHVGPVMQRLRETLTGIQSGEIEDRFGWVHKIDVE